MLGLIVGFPGGSDGKESACNAGDLGSIPGLGTSPGGGHGNPLQDSCLENSMDRGVWWATVHGVTENQTRLSTHACVGVFGILKFWNSMIETPSKAFQG